MKLQNSRSNISNTRLTQAQSVRCSALLLGVAVLLTGCDGGALISSTSPQTPAVSGFPPAIAVDSVAIISNDSSVAEGVIANSLLEGPVRIMATGDSITQGIVGASSYRKPFTSLMETANCSFEMVGSQASNLTSVDPTCIDTGAIGDGWGWDGTQSCLVGAEASTEGYSGAHEGYSSHRADHFLTGHTTSVGSNEGISASMATFSPGVVLLHVGSVDMYNQQDVTSTLKDIKNVVDTIYETKPETVVLIANIIPWYSSNPYPEIGSDISLLGDGVEQYVASENNPLLRLVDVRTGFTSTMMMTDMIHPNEMGELHIAQAFMGAYSSIANCSSN